MVSASQPSWLRLVHYESDSSSPTGWRSAIYSDTFFLSSEGETDPTAELISTVAAMNQPPVPGATDQHAQCRFPARYLWLQQNLASSLTHEKVVCPLFSEWTRGNSVESVSVIFATGYLGNPASYYGHTLLKFNFHKRVKQSSLQDLSINYGAIDTLNDDPISYILKGVFGGYEGGFSDTQYYYHNHNYGENELRDLWEYRLNLSEDAVALIVAHAWEVLGKRYNYYFFRQNCAYRMAEIVQVVEGINFIPKIPMWTIPQSLMQGLADESSMDDPLVEEITYHPSRQSRFYDKYQLLDETELALLYEQVESENAINGQRFDALPVERQHLLLDVLMDYYQFIGASGDDNGGTNPAYTKILVKRYQLPPGEVSDAPHDKSPPHQGRAPSWLQIGWLQGDRLANQPYLRVRPAYYDALDADAGHVANAGLAMGEIQIRIDEQKVKLHRLDLVAIESVNSAFSGLPGDRGQAWRLRFGAEPASPGCDDCLLARLQGDMGIGRSLTKKFFAATYLGGAVQERYHTQGNGFVRGVGTLIATPSDNLSGRLAYEHRIPLQHVHEREDIFDLELRVALGKKGDLRIRHERAEGYLTTVGMGVYW